VAAAPPTDADPFASLAVPDGVASPASEPPIRSHP